MSCYNFPIRSYDVYFSDEHWRVLNQCARKVAKRFNNRVEVGDLITEAWLQYARHRPNLERCHGFVFKSICRWARAWIHHTLQSLDEPTETVDKNFSTPVIELKTCEDAEEFLKEEEKLIRRIKLLPEKQKMAVELYAFGELPVKKIMPIVGLSRERVRQILKKVAA